jgi:hypothetical protein
MSPRIYNYLQISLEFYSNEPKSEGAHVHAVSRDNERGIKALFDMNKAGFPIKWVPIAKKGPLKSKELVLAKELILDVKPEIIKKWVDFRMGKKIKPITITKRIK